MEIHSWRDFLLLAIAGGFGGYTYWTVAQTVAALRVRARAKRGLK